MNGQPPDSSIQGPRAFVSYSRDSPDHTASVLALATRLRQDGVYCMMDVWEESPPQGWPAWLSEQIDESDFVLVISTARYAEKAKERSPNASEERFESVLVLQELYDAGMWNEKFVPVLLDGAGRQEIIRPLKPYSYYRADTDEGYDGLSPFDRTTPAFATARGQRQENAGRQCKWWIAGG